MLKALPRAIAALLLTLPLIAASRPDGPHTLWGKAEIGMDLDAVRRITPQGMLLTDPQADEHAALDDRLDVQWQVPARLAGHESMAYFYFMESALAVVIEESEGPRVDRPYADAVKAGISRRFSRPPVCDDAGWIMSCIWMGGEVTVTMTASFGKASHGVHVNAMATSYYRVTYPDGVREFEQGKPK